MLAIDSLYVHMMGMSFDKKKKKRAMENEREKEISGTIWFCSVLIQLSKHLLSVMCKTAY